MRRNGLAMETNREEFAVALKTWRLRRGLLQKEAAEEMHLSRWSIIRAEKAKSVSWETLYRIFAHISKDLS